jgi:hypothetical protein
MTKLVKQDGHEVTDGKGQVGDTRTAEPEIVIPSELEKIMKRFGMEIEVIGQVSIRLLPSKEDSPSSGTQTALQLSVSQLNLGYVPKFQD